MGALFGVVSKIPGRSVAEDLFFGTDYQSHRGGEYAGLAGSIKEKVPPRRIHALDSQFKDKFGGEYSEIAGDMGIGVLSNLEEQPIFESSQVGDFFIGIEGWISNRAEQKDQLVNRGISFSEIGEDKVNQAELVGKIISQGDDPRDGIRKVYDRIEGSLSLLLLTRDSLFLVDDRFPLVIGESEDCYAVASETCAFPNLGYEIHTFPEPGKVHRISSEGVEVVADLNLPKNRCAFQWMYTSDPTSVVEGVNVGKVRGKNGKILADKEEEVFDIFSAVPESGSSHAEGFVNRAIRQGKIKESGSILQKYTASYGRSYTPQSQEIRSQIADMKLIPNKKMIEGKKNGIMDDSVVRGTQLRNVTGKIWNSGAKEIHARIGSPPLLFPCKFSRSTKQVEELIWRRAIREIEGELEPDNLAEYLDPESRQYSEANELIADKLNLDSLIFQTMDGMIEAIGLPRDVLCDYCWVGT